MVLQSGILARLEEGTTIDLRADGKAGSGLVMILQTFADAVSRGGVYQSQEWPFFSSARKGANVRGFLRIGKGPIHVTCQIERPDIAVLVTERTGTEIDFAGGMSDGFYVINTERSPLEIAKSFQLRGEIFTVAGDRLGQEFLGRPIPNISVLAALQKALPLISVEQLLEALTETGRKRRLADRYLLANQSCFRSSLKEVRHATVLGEESWTHPLPAFAGYRGYPIGGQSRLRTSLTNQTANYAPPGRRLVFSDPLDRCNGCSLCIFNCPEGIIEFEPHEKLGVRVTGAKSNQFCKLCRECIEVCPVELFSEMREGA
ncbi:MAG: 2-oxoacid:acceptor oxidoreductase family protein [Deltaproteobacteria bacterium]|nr:2-oxoacid:acceptor oxidoreductase family protein [Deltaproteobacteria bacterium]